MSGDRRTESTSLRTVLDRATRSAVASMHVGMVGRVVAYDAARQRVDVQPVVRGRYEEGESFTFPRLVGVPVRFPCGGGFALTWPLVDGDFVWLDFGERSLDEWRSLGGDDVEPKTARRFDLADAVAYAGIRPDGQPLASASTDALVIGQDGGPSPLQLRVGPSGIDLGNGTDDLLDLVRQLVDALASATVATALGPSPLDPATQLLLTAIGEALDRIRTP